MKFKYAEWRKIEPRLEEGDTKEEALENIKEAIQLVLEVTRELVNNKRKFGQFWKLSSLSLK
jgi:predicted RNase H-like HicB family nuclease